MHWLTIHVCCMFNQLLKLNPAVVAITDFWSQVSIKKLLFIFPRVLRMVLTYVKNCGGVSISPGGGHLIGMVTEFCAEWKAQFIEIRCYL
jgi:hypothetical protein